MSTPLRAAIYARVSLDQTGEGLAVDRQQEACRKLAADRGWRVVESFVDNSVSASSGAPRPGFEALKGMIKAGQVDVIVSWHVDRLTRSLIDLEAVIKLAEASRVTIATVTGDLDLSTDTGRMLARILASVARGEVERKSARQRAATTQAAQAGKRVSGRRPFGYDDDGMTVRPGEANAIRDGYAALLAGEALAEIARRWNSAGLKSGQGSDWRHDSVRAVLSNPRNAGLRAYLGNIIGTARWPALVDESTYRGAVALLQNPARRSGPTGAKALLTGLALCGLCGDGTTVHAGGSNTRGVRNYRCSAGAHFARKAAPVDAYVRDVVVARLELPDAAELLVQRDLPDLAALRQEAQACRARLDSLATDFADGSLTSTQLRVATERLRDNLTAVESKMADAARVDILGPLVAAEDVRAAWDALSTSRQRTVLNLLATVTVYPPGRGVRTFDRATVRIEPRNDV